MLCINCGETIMQAGVEPNYQYDGKGTYVHCHSCDAKNYTEEESSNSGSSQ